MRKQVEIFTDGSCLGNPGPGGYGAILRYGAHEKEFSTGYRLTTNNRMEMMAAIVALEALKQPCEVVLSTTSQCSFNASSATMAAINSIRLLVVRK